MNVRAWLFRVATNLAQNLHRGESRARRREEAAAPPLPPGVTPEQLELQWQVHEALGAIDPRSRRVLLLFAEGFSYREIASITGVEPGYVGVLMHRARLEFRKHFEQPNVSALPFKRRLS